MVTSELAYLRSEMAKGFEQVNSSLQVLSGSVSDVATIHLPALLAPLAKASEDDVQPPEERTPSYPVLIGVTRQNNSARKIQRLVRHRLQQVALPSAVIEDAVQKATLRREARHSDLQVIKERHTLNWHVHLAALRWEATTRAHSTDLVQEYCAAQDLDKMLNSEVVAEAWWHRDSSLLLYAQAIVEEARELQVLDSEDDVHASSVDLPVSKAPVAAIASKDLQPGEASPKEVSFDPLFGELWVPAETFVDADSNSSYAMGADDSDAESVATDAAVGDLDILDIYGPQPNGDLWRVVRVKDWSVHTFEGVG